MISTANITGRRLSFNAFEYNREEGRVSRTFLGFLSPKIPTIFVDSRDGQELSSLSWIYFSRKVEMDFWPIK